MAHASGPVERIVQVLLHPSDPNVIVARWGVATDGYLFSRDGGKTFAALCSSALNPDAPRKDRIDRLSSQRVPGTAATLVDSTGHVWVTQLDGLWADDASGCAWTKDATIGDAWPYSLQLDPQDPTQLLAIVNKRTDGEARALLMRRDGSGAWTSFAEAGELVPHVALQQAYGSELVAARTETGTRLYASVAVSASASSVSQELRIVRSDDGGVTWSARATLPAEQQEGFTLLAVDPREPERLLAVQYRDSAADTLLLSEDGGLTFAAYGELRETSGVTFSGSGRVFIGDAGDSSSSEARGGLWTAERLGQPLSKLADTEGIDCVAWSSAKNALYTCKRDKLGTLDPETGAFTQLVSIATVPALLTCSGFDVAMACSDQLNEGASWCCAGHYPCTGFCSQYDVTTRDGRPLYCGRSGLAYDLMVGRVCESPPDAMDAGTEDAGVAGADAGLDAGLAAGGDAGPDAGSHDGAKAGGEPRKSSDDGCAVAAQPPSTRNAGGALVYLGLMLVLWGRSRRRNGRRGIGTRGEG